MELVDEADLRRLAPGQRLLIRIVTEADRLAFHRANPDDATHQLTLMAGTPFVTFLPERDTALSQEVTSRGFWELPESALLLSSIRPGMTVVDAGANIGYYTVLIARCLGTTGTVHAFEPEPDNFQTLLANTLLAQRILRDPPQFNISRSAFSDRCGTARFHRYSGNLGFHSLNYEDGSATDVIDVDTVTLDQLRGLAGVPASITRPINLLKADLQGAELQLLRGGASTIRRDRPMLCLEFEPYIGGDAICLEMIDWLKHHGYRNFRVFHSNQTGPAELLCELSRNRSGAEVKALVKSGAVGPFGTVFTWNGWLSVALPIKIARNQVSSCHSNPDPHPHQTQDAPEPRWKLRSVYVYCVCPPIPDTTAFGQRNSPGGFRSQTTLPSLPMRSLLHSLARVGHIDRVQFVRRAHPGGAAMNRGDSIKAFVDAQQTTVFRTAVIPAERRIRPRAKKSEKQGI